MWGIWYTIVLSIYWVSQYLIHNFLTEKETIYVFVVYFVSRDSNVTVIALKRSVLYSSSQVFIH